MTTTVEITENITRVDVTENVTTVNITPTVTELEVKGISIATTSATGIGTTHGEGSRFTSVTVQGSLDQASSGLDSVSATAVSSFVNVTGDTMTGPLEINSSGSTYDAPGSPGSDSSTTVAIALEEGQRIVNHKDGFIRNLISRNTSSDIQIGQNDTSYINNIALRPGNAGNIIFNSSHENDTITLKANSTFIIDPEAHGDNTGKVIIAGDLEVEGVTTTVDSTTVNIADKNIELGYNALTDLQNDGAGITVSRPESTDATITWDETDDRFAMTNGLYLQGDLQLNGFPESTYEVKGDMDGGIRFHAQADEDLVKGDVVYISGASGDNTLIRKARADSASTMPAFGLCLTAATSGDQVQVVTFGNLYGSGSPALRLNTSAYDPGTTLYVSATEAGVWTSEKPASESNFIQNIGKVIRSSTNNGVIKVGGAGRTNATGNLDEGNIFIGSASGRAVTSSLSSEFTSRFNTAIASTTSDINTVSSAVVAVDGRVDTVSSAAATNASDINTVSSAVVSANARIDSLSAEIVSNTASTSRLDSLSARIATNASDINTVSAAAATNASDINTVSSAVVAVDGRVDTVSSGLVTVNGRVDTVSSAVVTVDGRVDTVSSGLVTVNGRVDTVSSAVVTVNGRVDTVSSAVVTVNGRVDTVSSAAATNASDINTVSSAVVTVNGRVDTVSSAVAGITEYTDTAVQTYLDGGSASATFAAVRINDVSVTSGNLTGAEFKAAAGTRILNKNGIASYGIFQPTTADIGLTWTIMNASGGEITLSSWNTQYVHHLNGSDTGGKKTNWQLETGAVVEVICIDDNANGGSSGTEANFVIYGSGIVDL